MEKHILKVASFNIQSTRGYPDNSIIDVNFSGDVIKEYMPDIVGLNEVSYGTLYGEQPKELAEICTYPYYYYAPVIRINEKFEMTNCENFCDISEISPTERLYGNGLLSKYPIKKAEMIRIDDAKVITEGEPFEPRGILKAEIDIFGGITVLVTHFGLMDEEKQNAVKKLIELIEVNPQKTILMGDFNVKPYEDYLTPIKERLCDTANGYDEEELKSHPADNPDKKIDYIFASGDFKAEKVYMSERIGSDHKMIIAELSL